MTTKPSAAVRQARSNIEKARLALNAAMHNAQLVAINEAENGTPETHLAQYLGVNRLTIRRWLGKQ